MSSCVCSKSSAKERGCWRVFLDIDLVTIVKSRLSKLMQLATLAARFPSLALKGAPRSIKSQHMELLLCQENP